MSGPRIVFCSNNHIYDASLYDECPYCSKIEAEQKELVATAAPADPYAGALTGADGSVSKDLFSEDPFANDPSAGADAGFPGEPAGLFGPESADEDPYGATVVGTGPAADFGKYEFGDAFGSSAPGNIASGDDTLKRDDGPSGPYGESAESKYGAFDADATIADLSLKQPVPTGWMADTDSGASREDMSEEEESSGADSSAAELLPGADRPEPEVPSGADAPAAEGLSGTGGSEAEAGFSGPAEDPHEKTFPGSPEVASTDVINGLSPENEKRSVKESEAPVSGESDDLFSDEDKWDAFPLKNEGPVRGWFVLQNGVQKDHSVELCKKSMFIYDYDGICLVYSKQMEDMTLLATIEQYKTISILPAPGVPFEVNGEAKRSCGKLLEYMKLLIGSHRMVYVPVNDRLLNGEK